jgi:hypothetical protein
VAPGVGAVVETLRCVTQLANLSIRRDSSPCPSGVWADNVREDVTACSAGASIPGTSLRNSQDCVTTSVSSIMVTTECSFAGLFDVKNILSADTGIFRKTENHSFGDHLIRGSLTVKQSSVIEVFVALCSVSL